MFRRAMEGTCLGELVSLAIPLCQAAATLLQAQCPRTGPGRIPQYQQWQIAVLIMIGVLKKRKTKSSQHRFLEQNREAVCRVLQLERLPARSTYFDRYSTGHRLFQIAIELQGRQALREGVTQARTVAVDKSLVAARGPTPPPAKPRYACSVKRRRAVDGQAGWSYSKHDNWVWGYSYEVLVSAAPGRLVMPLLASAQPANVNEHRTFGAKIGRLPRSVKNVLADAGYDNNRFGEQIEYDAHGRRTGRHWICPLLSRGGKPAVGRYAHRGARERRRQHRLARQRFYQSCRGHKLYARRLKTIEPFNQWFKRLFDLQHQVWHRGLGNNQTQLLAAIFCYQLLIRHAHRLGRRDAQIQWILDGL